MSCAGLAGCDKLGKADHIIIFFTANAKKIDMTEIADHGEAELKMIEVPTGKQSEDMHIGSYMGYLIGKHGDGDCKIVIISKDTDFDNVIKFWKKFGVQAARTLQIKNYAQKQQAAIKVSNAEKAQIEQEAMQAVSDAGINDAVARMVAKVVVQAAAERYGEVHMLTEVHNRLRENHANYLELYNIVKPVLLKCAGQTVKPALPAAKPKEQAPTLPAAKPKEQAPALPAAEPKEQAPALPAAEPEAQTPAAPNAKTELNTVVMRLLSKAGYTHDIITHVASIVAKFFEIENGKLQVYRGIVSTYGRTKGLEIYNHIKMHI